MGKKTLLWISPTTRHPNRCSADQLCLFTFRRKKKTDKVIKKIDITLLKNPMNLSYSEFLIVFLTKQRKQRILYQPKTERSGYSSPPPLLPTSFELHSRLFNLECSRKKNIGLITNFRFPHKMRHQTQTETQVIHRGYISY